ncbi:hypothetical protein [Flexivirga sp.]|uniref:hypothetical protein n=1 Tax=Flexivirga sp. TaxID=1962927 RepID=UPI003F81C502
MFWIIVLIVFVALCGGMLLLQRSRGGGGDGSGSGVDNHNALQNGAAKAYGTRQQRDQGPWV